MLVEISRKSAFVFSMYTASIIVDGRRVGEIKNGKTATIEIPTDSRAISVRTGPYVSEPMDLSTSDQELKYHIEPKTKLGGGNFVAFAFLGSALSAAYSAKLLLIFLGIAILIDLIWLRKKWRIEAICPEQN